MQTTLNSSKPVQLLIAPPAVAICEFLSRHQSWLEAVVGCPLADAVTFEFHLPFSHLVLSTLRVMVACPRNHHAERDVYGKRAIFLMYAFPACSAAAIILQ